MIATVCTGQNVFFVAKYNKSVFMDRTFGGGIGFGIFMFDICDHSTAGIF